MSVEHERAYSQIEVKSFDEEKREIVGIATTPSIDVVGDIVEPEGAQFKLPMPLLLFHNHELPVGNVVEAKATSKGITFKAIIPKILEEGEAKTLADKAWHMVKYGLIRAVSIGFRASDAEFMEEGGFRFSDWLWHELSLVTVPAQSEATIDVIRSIDTKARAALGNGVVSKSEKTPCVKGKSAPALGKSVKLLTPKGENLMAKKTIAEQIEDYRATLSQKTAQRDDMMEDAFEKGETLSGEESAEYDALEVEIKSVEDHIERLERLQETKAATATPAGEATTAKAGTAARTAARVKPAKAEKGIAFARYAKALALGKGNLMQSYEVAKNFEDTPQVANVLKAAVAGGTTTDPAWAAPLVEYNQMASEFLELLQPATIMGRIEGWNLVPFKVNVPSMTSGTSVNWVGEGKHKPVSAAAFGNVKVEQHKTAGIVVLSDELIRLSSPAADRIVRDNMVAENTRFLDTAMLDPTLAAVAGENPASLTNGVTAITSAGVDAAAVRNDINGLLKNFITANLGAAGATIVMSEQNAAAISFMTNALGQPEFTGMGVSGGTLLGIPVITSENVPAGQITMIKANSVFVADDGSVMLDASNEASLVMDSDPEAVADPKPLVSMWQTNQVALRAERYISWTKGRAAAVQLVTGANYTL